jgi:hypothetical protein
MVTIREQTTLQASLQMDTGQGERNAAVENQKSHTQELYTDLLTLIREMFIHYRRLLQLSKREILTAASLPTLIEIAMQKETILLELSIMEEGRQLLLRKLDEQLGIHPSALTLGKLNELAPEPLTSAFQNFTKIFHLSFTLQRR